MVTHSTPRRLRIALRLADMSEWGRQILRGVQSFAHTKSDWQLAVLAGSVETIGRYDGLQWDGLLTHMLSNVREIRRLVDTEKTRVVAFTAAVPEELSDLPAVRVNEDAVAAAIVRHLMAGGFRRIAYHRWHVGRPIVDFRLQALERAAREAGCELIISSAGKTKGVSLINYKKWIATLPKPVGILGWSMPLSRLLTQACVQMGQRIPEDIAIVSWDDDPLLAESDEPSVSGTVLPVEKLGYEAAALLDRLLRGHEAPKRTTIVDPSGLIRIRQSSDVSNIADREVHLALQFIQEHANEPIRVDDLVRTIAVSRRKLEQDFRRITNQTINNVIVQAHMDRAKQLLLETDWPLEKLSEAAGFGTKRQFHRLFQQHEQMSPTQFRVRYRVN